VVGYLLKMQQVTHKESIYPVLTAAPEGRFCRSVQILWRNIKSHRTASEIRAIFSQAEIVGTAKNCHMTISGCCPKQAAVTGKHSAEGKKDTPRKQSIYRQDIEEQTNTKWREENLFVSCKLAF
jgi:hypothetical protein